jgi:hypothetical protein
VSLCSAWSSPPAPAIRTIPGIHKKSEFGFASHVFSGDHPPFFYPIDPRIQRGGLAENRLAGILHPRAVQNAQKYGFVVYFLRIELPISLVLSAAGSHRPFSRPIWARLVRFEGAPTGHHSARSSTTLRQPKMVSIQQVNDFKPA